MLPHEWAQLNDARQEIASTLQYRMGRSMSEFLYDPTSPYQNPLEERYQFRTSIIEKGLERGLHTRIKQAAEHIREIINKKDPDCVVVAGYSGEVLFHSLYKESILHTIGEIPVLWFRDRENTILYQHAIDTGDTEAGADLDEKLRQLLQRENQQLPRHIVLLDDIVERGKKAQLSTIHLRQVGVGRVTYAVLTSLTVNELVPIVGTQDEDVYFFVQQIIRALDCSHDITLGNVPEGTDFKKAQHFIVSALAPLLVMLPIGTRNEV